MAADRKAIVRMAIMVVDDKVVCEGEQQVVSSLLSPFLPFPLSLPSLLQLVLPVVVVEEEEEEEEEVVGAAEVLLDYHHKVVVVAGKVEEPDMAEAVVGMVEGKDWSSEVDHMVARLVEVAGLVDHTLAAYRIEVVVP